MSKEKDLCFGCHKKTLECLEENPPHYKCPDCGYEALFPRSTALTGSNNPTNLKEVAS